MKSCLSYHVSFLRKPEISSDFPSTSRTCKRYLHSQQRTHYFDSSSHHTMLNKSDINFQAKFIQEFSAGLGGKQLIKNRILTNFAAQRMVELN